MTNSTYSVVHFIECFSLPSETFIYDLIIRLSHLCPHQAIIANHLFLRKSRPFKNLYLIKPFNSLVHKLWHYMFMYWTLPNGKKILNLITELNADIIHAHFGVNGVKIFSLIERFELKKALVVSFHGTDVSMLSTHQKYRSIVLSMASYKHSQFVFPSRYLYNQFLNSIHTADTERMHIVPNCVCLPSQTQDKIIKTDCFEILSVGRAVKIKGYTYLIDALNLLKEVRTDWHATIIGDGPLLPRLKRKVDLLGLTEYISFLGFIEHKNVINYMQLSDVYVQPSIALNTLQCESFGLSVLESLYLRKPVIVTNTGGLPDTVLGGHPSHAHIIPDKCPDSILQSLLFFIDNPPKPGLSPYHEKVISTYSTSNNITKYASVYAQSLSKLGLP